MAENLWGTWPLIFPYISWLATSGYTSCGDKLLPIVILDHLGPSWTILDHLGPLQVNCTWGCHLDLMLGLGRSMHPSRIPLGILSGRSFITHQTSVKRPWEPDWVPVFWRDLRFMWHGCDPQPMIHGLCPWISLSCWHIRYPSRQGTPHIPSVQIQSSPQENGRRNLAECHAVVPHFLTLYPLARTHGRPENARYVNGFPAGEWTYYCWEYLLYTSRQVPIFARFGRGLWSEWVQMKSGQCVQSLIPDRGLCPQMLTDRCCNT